MILQAGYSDEAKALWDAATALNRAAAAVSPRAAALPPLLFFTDPERTPCPWETAARLPSGSAVVYRAFGAADAVQTGLRLRQMTADAGVKLLIGRDVDLAAKVKADGLHLPEREADRATNIRTEHPDWLLTAAWHGAPSPLIQELDAFILSPVFPAGGASASRRALGVTAFRDKVRSIAAPIYALGGVSALNARQLIGSGACGLAGVDAVRSAFR